MSKKQKQETEKRPPIASSFVNREDLRKGTSAELPKDVKILAASDPERVNYIKGPRGGTHS